MSNGQFCRSRRTFRWSVEADSGKSTRDKGWCDNDDISEPMSFGIRHACNQSTGSIEQDGHSDEVIILQTIMNRHGHISETNQ